MKTMYLMEHYAINRKNGVRTYIGSACVEFRVKNLVMKSVRNHGYQYNRSKKAYILEADSVESCTDKAITVKSYAI
jgi:hypothetical protein